MLSNKATDINVKYVTMQINQWLQFVMIFKSDNLLQDYMSHAGVCLKGGMWCTRLNLVQRFGDNILQTYIINTKYTYNKLHWCLKRI